MKKIKKVPPKSLSGVHFRGFNKDNEYTQNSKQIFLIIPSCIPSALTVGVLKRVV